MFLSNLSEKEKKLFLQLSLHLSHSDNDFSDEEKLVIDTLSQEMSIPVSYEIEQAYEDVLKELAQTADPRNKKCIIFELAGVVMADEVYADVEKQIMEQISDALGVERSVAERSVRLITQMADIYKEAAALVLT